MIKFDITKLRVKHMHIKQVSSALGGMITVVDEKKTKRNGGKEVFKKIKISHQIARHFKKRYTICKYLKPVLTAVTFYGNHIVALERHPLGNLGQSKSEGLFGEVTWTSDSEFNIDTVIVPLDRANDFLFDGTFLYTIQENDLRQSKSLSSDHRFKAVDVKAIKLLHLGENDKLRPELRTALAYKPNGGKTFTTPPIWKTLANVGAQQLKQRKKISTELDQDDDDDYAAGDLAMIDSYQFDKVDTYLSVNLAFALKAGRELSNVFGYNVIEPLCLDDLMIQMRTVNLPQIANEVKQTYDTGMPFTHAVAWLIGLTNRTKSLDSFITLRSLLKHLTTKGVYRKGAFDPSQIFKDPNVVQVPLKTIQQAGAVDKVSTDTALQMGRIARTNTSQSDDGTAGGLYDAT